MLKSVIASSLHSFQPQRQIATRTRSDPLHIMFGFRSAGQWQDFFKDVFLTVNPTLCSPHPSFPPPFPLTSLLLLCPSQSFTQHPSEMKIYQPLKVFLITLLMSNKKEHPCKSFVPELASEAEGQRYCLWIRLSDKLSISNFIGWAGFL